MSKREVFYEITHRGRSAGFFKTREAAERGADQFRTEIEGGLYPVEVITREFLDYAFREEEHRFGDSNGWENGAV